MPRFSRDRIITGKKAIISDIGKVIVDFIGQENNESFYGMCDKSMDAIGTFFRSGEHFFAYERGQVSTADFFEILKRELGFRGNMEEFRRTFMGIFSLKKDVYDLYFSEIKPAYDIDFFLLSNINELHHSEIRGRWPGIFENCFGTWLSYQLGCRKPEPKIFEIALGDLRKMGISGHECIFVDDLEENVRAARECGILSSIRFENVEQLRAAFAALSIKT